MLSQLRCFYGARCSCVRYMTAAKVLDTISRLPGCSGEASAAMSAIPPVEMTDAPSLLRLPEADCPLIWAWLPRSTRPRSWGSVEGPFVPLECNLHGHPLAVLLWKGTFENILLDECWDKVFGLECSHITENMVCLLQKTSTIPK